MIINKRLPVQRFFNVQDNFVRILHTVPFPLIGKYFLIKYFGKQIFQRADIAKASLIGIA